MNRSSPALTITPGWRARARRHHFTLVELLVAMSVLVVLMFMLFRFFGAAQTAWTTTSANTRVYENARVAMELISRDLRTAVVSDQAGLQIPFYYDAATDRVTCVTPTTVGTDSIDSKLCEVSYFTTDGTAVDPIEKYALYRRAVSDANTGWDFLGATDAAWATSATDAAAQPVIAGVESLSIRCFTSAGAELTTGSGTSLPQYCQITMTVFDERLAELATELGGTGWQNKVDASKRTFTKIVFLPRQ